MTNFEECKTEWLKYAQEEKILISEIKKKIDIVLNQQKEIGTYFSFPRYETIDTVKRHHWFFHQFESESILKCPCCNLDNISKTDISIEIDYFNVYECPSCDYFSIQRQRYVDTYYTYLYSSSNQSLRKFNSQLDKHLNNDNRDNKNITKKSEGV